ncbi:hypothetical protein ACFUOZ_20600, partial [Paenarthrobacter sp. NPDC057355]|uniref:hypothetical protein n=1 Tax=Paenarthrobacter sp. NPDC057355 TaxID=3346105 RepID=UPI0036417BC1
MEGALMVLGLWSSRAGVGADQGPMVPGCGTSGLWARLLGVVLAVAVTLTLFVVVDVASGPAANAAPPKVVATTPPRVTDPNSVHRLGFPFVEWQSPTDAPQFDAVEVYPGIWIANHASPEGIWLEAGKNWGPSHSEAEWQRNVDLITKDLDRLWSTKPGRTSMEVAGGLHVEGNVKGSQWLDHTKGRSFTPGTANPDIGVVIFPTPGKSAEATVLWDEGTGAASYLKVDPEIVQGMYDVDTGAVFGLDPAGVLGHELIHCADYKAATIPDSVQMDTPYNIFEGGTPEGTVGRVVPKKDPLDVSEILTMGGETETTLLMEHLKANPKLSPLPPQDLSIKSNPWRIKGAEKSLNRIVSAGDKVTPTMLKRATLMSKWAIENPTEAKIGTELETLIRKGYLGARHSSPGGKTRIAETFTRNPAAGVLTREDLANPHRSSKLRPAATIEVPVCGAGAHALCIPDPEKSKPMSEEEVKAFEEEVKTRLELEKSSTSESVFFESLSVEDMQVLAGMGVSGSPEMVRDAVRFAPEVRGGGGKGPLVEGPGGVGT